MFGRATHHQAFLSAGAYRCPVIRARRSPHFGGSLRSRGLPLAPGAGSPFGRVAPSLPFSPPHSALPVATLPAPSCGAPVATLSLRSSPRAVEWFVCRRGRSVAVLRGVAVPVFGAVPPHGRVLPLVVRFRARATLAPHLSGDPSLRVPSPLPYAPPLRSIIGVWSCYAPPSVFIGSRLPMPQSRCVPCSVGLFVPAGTPPPSVGL